MTLSFRPADVPDSPVARWDPRWKLAAVLVATAGTAALRDPLPAAISLMAAVGLNVAGRVPVGEVVGRLGLVAIGVLPVLVFVPFTANADVPGAVGVLLRAVAIGAFALALLRTAPPARTFAAARALRVPGLLVQVSQLAHRYAVLLAAEARRTRVALRTRGFRARTDAHTYRALGHAVGGLIVRGGDRAERVAAAMRCRGFDGTYRSAERFGTTTADVLAFVAMAAGTVAVVLLDRA